VNEFANATLDAVPWPKAQVIADMDIQGFRLHPLKGADRGRWSIWVNGNWRLTFEFRDDQAYVLDYEDYH
jgi:proteic killer suppression protein